MIAPNPAPALRRVAALAALSVVAACASSASVTDPLTGMRLVRIRAGAFTMGSPPDEAQRGEDETPHRVTLTRDFYLGAFEVTQAEWARVVHANPSQHAGCDACPVERVNYFDVERFLAQLNAVSRLFRYRLPTEAEWEYACRAGTTTPFATGATLSTEQANYNGAYPYAGAAPGQNRGQTTPAARFAPNAWGLFDMHGNVWEWTSDWYAAYPPDAATDSIGPAGGDKRVIRGGSWVFGADSARCAGRYTHAPEDLGFSLGVRVAANRR